MTSKTERINVALKAHVTRHAEGWEFADLIKTLHLWAERFIAEFHLGCPVPAITIEPLGRRRLGHYRLARNGFGLFDEIAIDEAHAKMSPLWRVLGTLLHELGHEWQFVAHDRKRDACGKRNHHNVEYRNFMAALGLDIDKRGCTSYPTGDTPFRKLLQVNGVDLSENTMPTRIIARRGSKLKLWECRCAEPVKLRVGRPDIAVRCEECGHLFTQKE